MTHDLAFFETHRISLLRAASGEFDSVVVCSDDDPARRRMAEMTELVAIPMHRLLAQPWREARSVFALRRVLRALRPSVVHAIAIKAVYLTAIAGPPHDGGYLDSFTGLGRWFAGRGWQRDVRAWAACRGYARYAHRRRRTVAHFQNASDRAQFVGRGLRAELTEIVGGAGVDLKAYPTPTWPRPARVVMLARTVWAKGVRTFVDAVARLRARWPQCEFVVAGSAWADDPDAVPTSYKEHAAATTGVQWLGHVTDVARLLLASRIVCLPSMYEGSPKALQEAAAAMTVRIGSAVPGIATVIADGEDGLLHRPGDGMALAEAIDRVLTDGTLAERLARAARARAVAHFGVERVQDRTIEVYRRLCA